MKLHGAATHQLAWRCLPLVVTRPPSLSSYPVDPRDMHVCLSCKTPLSVVYRYLCLMLSLPCSKLLVTWPYVYHNLNYK